MQTAHGHLWQMNLVEYKEALSLNPYQHYPLISLITASLEVLRRPHSAEVSQLHPSFSSFLFQMATTMATQCMLLFLFASAVAGSRTSALKTSSTDLLIAEVCSNSNIICSNTAKKISPDSSIVTINDMQLDFFLESALVAGNKMSLAENLYDPAPKTAFLTSAAANALPTLAPYTVEALVKYFGVARDSRMATAIATAAYLCGTAALPGEARSCAASVESMAAFVTAELGAKVKVYSTSGAPASAPTVKAPVTVSAVAKGPVEEGKRIVVCHHLAFPSGLYYCHRVSGTKVVQATLTPASDGSGATAINGVGICHINTALWLSRHPAFAALKIARGEEACHWLVEGDLVFTPVMAQNE